MTPYTTEEELKAAMFTRGQEQHLLRVLGRNDAMLFLGAGFAVGATNRSGTSLPLATELAKRLWEFLEYDGMYDSTPLPEMFEAALQEGIPHMSIRVFLEDHLLVAHVPPQYDAITRPYWYRVYTTNIDDLLSTVYHRSAPPRGHVLSYPKSEPIERDPTLDRIQIIHLNGALPCSPNDITLSVRQYAKRSGVTSPLYEQFVRDYATRTTVFIGTELNESILWEHIEARERRGQKVTEHRPQSYLIAPAISRPKRAQLKHFHVVPIEGTTDDFLAWLAAHSPTLLTKQQVLQITMPSLVNIFERAGEHPKKRRDLIEFGQSFHLVPSDMAVSNDRSYYLRGASPRWEDIHRNLDAPRHITSAICTYVEGWLDRNVRPTTSVCAILGSAGCGKSTILRRLGLMLTQTGRIVFLTNSESLPDVKSICAALSSFDRRCVLMFDNAEVALGQIAQIVSETRLLEFPPLLLLASRSNDYEQRAAGLDSVTNVKEWDVPHDLARDEIVGVLDTLDRNRLLGKLRGLDQAARIREFESRANRQLLVAMREATSGIGFDQIIRNEFDTLPSLESKTLYLCTALATDAGYRVSEQQFIACADVSPATALHVLKRNLAGIVIPTGPRSDLLLLRHRLIAKFVLDEVAPRNQVSEAYRRLLRVVGPEVAGLGRRSRTFGLYRQLLNHKKLFHRFVSSVDEARTIYDSIHGRVANDFDYWLQYGLLELEFGHLDLAENYLHQAESLYPKSDYVRNSIGHLLLRKGIEAASPTAAMQFRNEGSKLLVEQMENTGSPYPYHIYGRQRLNWMRKWVLDKGKVKREIEHLREVVRRGRRRHGADGRLRELS